MANEKEYNTLPEPVKKGEEKIVVNQIELRSADRSRKDIQDWKNALITAESVYMPNRTRLYDVYADILLDGHLTGIIGKRMDAVLNKNLYFEDAKGDKVDKMDDLIQHRDFRRFCRTLLETPLWGLSGVEFIPGGEFEFKLIPRKHIKPKWGIISYQQNGIDGISYLDNPNLLIFGEAADLGLLLKCAPYALLKRGNLADWGQFIEIFGQPMRVIKYDAYDRQAKVELKEVLDESGSSLALLIPKTADFELMDGKTANANGDLQDKFTKSLNDEMSITILGNTETTGNNNGGSNAKAKEQGKQQLEITKSDIKYLTGWLNSTQFLDILRSYGYPVKGGRFTFEKEIDLDAVVQQMSIANQAKNMGVPVDDDYIYDLTGIPKPKNYDILKKEAVAQRQMWLQGRYSRADTDTSEGQHRKPYPGDPPRKDTQLVDNLWDKLRLKLADFFDPAP